MRRPLRIQAVIQFTDSSELIYDRYALIPFLQRRFIRRAGAKKHILASMRRNIFAPALCLLSFLLLIGTVEAQESGAKAPALEGIVTPNFRISLPAPIKVSTTNNVSTPWGRATETLYRVCARVGSDECGEYYGFSDFAFSPSRPLPTKRLKQVGSFFLRGKKCGADVKVSPPIWNDSRGKPWPQALFRGTCAAPEVFLLLTAIANGHVYLVHVAQNLNGPHTASLNGALIWMIEHIQLTER